MERTKRLADILVNYSLTIKKDDIIIIQCDKASIPLAQECYRLILERGAFPRVKFSLPGQQYIYFNHAKNNHLTNMSKLDLEEMKKSAGIIMIKSSDNTKELTNIDPKKVALKRKANHPIHKIRWKKDNWVIVGYPSNGQAQDAGMSLEEFEDFVFGATNIDWKKGRKIETKVKKILDSGKQVRIVGKETDITFSIKGMKSIKSEGKRNVPDGEVYTCPIPKTVNGHIFYDYPAIYGGKEVTNVRLWFKNGKVVKATADNNQDYLKEMITMDKGASYLGELGIGTNPGIHKFIKSILFDEKIEYSIHLALGNSFPECGKGGNESALHWDMIKDLKKGGAIYIDGKCIQKNGKWLI